MDKSDETPTSKPIIPAEVKRYVNYCLDEICRIDGSQNFNDIVNNLTECQTIDAALEFWETSDPDAFATSYLYDKYFSIEYNIGKYE